jgi:hypothetical protein
MVQIQRETASHRVAEINNDAALLVMIANPFRDFGYIEVGGCHLRAKLCTTPMLVVVPIPFPAFGEVLIEKESFLHPLSETKLRVTPQALIEPCGSGSLRADAYDF